MHMLYDVVGKHDTSCGSRVVTEDGDRSYSGRGSGPNVAMKTLVEQ